MTVNLDYSETPHLEKWGKEAKQLLLDWFPISKNENGWEDAYQLTGGFLLWLTLEKKSKYC